MPNREPFPIPSELTPDTVCLQIQIPNNDDWKQVLLGLLAQPSYWFNWERDSDHSGKTLASYWNELFVSIDWSDMSCCCDQPPAIFRYNDDGVYQRSTDGGATWTDAPGYDYRNTSTTFPPPSVLGIPNTKCQAADSAVHVIDTEIIQALDEAFAAAQILALIAAVLLAVLSAGSLAAMTPLITAIGSAIIDVGVTATQAAFTEDVWNRFRCNIFNHMTSDDATDAAGFTAILAQIATDESGIVESVLYGIVNAAGVVGINNMIRSNKGDPDADCSDCSDVCPVEWTFYGVTDVVQDMDNPNIWHMNAIGNPTHIAFASGDIDNGCYVDMPGTGFTWWPVGSVTPVDPTDPRDTPVYNADFGGDLGAGAGGAVIFTFSKHPIAH